MAREASQVITGYEPVIGLEVHVQLKTKSKIFCACSTEFGREPNENTCPVCLGLPGSLPVLNERALELAIRVGLALNCQVSPVIKFDRKNYFYPDLPKAYQISQYDKPVSSKGHLTIDFKQNGEVVKKKIGVTRAHLEEDAGKLLHEGVRDGSWVDYNRAGVPLLEIVSEPDLRSPEEAFQYLTSLKAILQYLDVSDCNMEEGSLRCDANVSVRKKGESQFGTKVEIKNMNSFRAVQKAIAYEIKRQIEANETGEKIVQETRLWNESKGETSSMRSKEYAHDYRYFPEPDLVPFSVSKEQIEKFRKSLPELPQARAERFRSQYSLSEYDAYVLVSDKTLGDYFESCVKEKVSPKLASNWIQTETLALVNSSGSTIQNFKLSPTATAGTLRLIERGIISGKIAKEVYSIQFESFPEKSAEEIVKEKDLVQVTDTASLEAVVGKVIQANPKVVADFKEGKAQALGFLVGQVMKETKGKANPALVNDILRKKLAGG